MLDNDVRWQWLRCQLLAASLCEYSFTVVAKLACRRNVAVQRLTADAEFLAEIADCRAGLAHGRHGQSNFRWGHFVGASAAAAAGAGCCEAGERALSDEFAFELGQGGKDAEDELS